MCCAPAGKAKAIVKGAGTNLPDPPLGALTLPVTAQLVNGSLCLGAEFDMTNVLKNDATLTEQQSVFPARRGGL
jgi:hypothetical protein